MFALARKLSLFINLRWIIRTPCRFKVQVRTTLLFFEFISLFYFILGTFHCECEGVGVFEESLVVMEQQRVTMRTIQGTVKQILFILPTEGEPIIMATFRHFVAVITSEGALRLWDISRR